MTSMGGEQLAKVHQLRPRRRGILSQWPIIVVLCCMALSLIVVATTHFRLGSLMLAASVILAFVLRLVLPTRQVGLLAVRSRTVDLIVLGVLGGSLALFALWVPPPSG